MIGRGGPYLPRWPSASWKGLVGHGLRLESLTQGDKAKTVELLPSGFDVKSFPSQSRSRGGGIATVYKSTLASNITLKTNFDFTHTSFLLHSTTHYIFSVCTALHQTYETILLTLYLLNS